MRGRERGRDGGSANGLERNSFLGHDIPNAGPHPIPLDAVVHESVIKRMQYQPVNMPTRYRVIEMPCGPTDQPA
jgi:hypothetical protein